MSFGSEDSLVSCEWLRENLGRPNIKVVDTTYYLANEGKDPKKEFLEKHIPGSTFFDIDEVSDKSVPLPHMMPSPELFEKAVGEMGIGNDDKVIVYDARGLFSAGRLWWTFRCMGHPNVAVLNGGLVKWSALGYPTESGPAKPAAPKAFRAKFDASVIRSLKDMTANVSSKSEQVVDARSADRFHARVPEPRPGLRGGHIPGSLSVPFNSLLDPNDSNTVRSPAELRKLFESAGVDLSKPVVASCGSGLTACTLLFGLHMVGKRDISLYDGSWTEWGSHTDTPIEK